MPLQRSCIHCHIVVCTVLDNCWEIPVRIMVCLWITDAPTEKLYSPSYCRVLDNCWELPVRIKMLTWCESSTMWVHKVQLNDICSNCYCFNFHSTFSSKKCGKCSNMSTMSGMNVQVMNTHQTILLNLLILVYWGHWTIGGKLAGQDHAQNLHPNAALLLGILRLLQLFVYNAEEL